MSITAYPPPLWVRGNHQSGLGWSQYHTPWVGYDRPIFALEIVALEFAGLTIDPSAYFELAEEKSRKGDPMIFLPFNYGQVYRLSQLPSLYMMYCNTCDQPLLWKFLRATKSADIQSNSAKCWANVFKFSNFQPAIF